MNKSIEFTQLQIKAYENGATMFIVPIKESMQYGAETMENYVFTNRYTPIQKGDKDIFIKEEFRLYTETQIDYKADTPNINLDWEDASKMTKEQSRYTISECIDVRDVRVKDIKAVEMCDIISAKNKDISNYNDFIVCYNNQLKEHNINRTYEDNDYVFLIEVKK